MYRKPYAGMSKINWIRTERVEACKTGVYCVLLRSHFCSYAYVCKTFSCQHLVNTNIYLFLPFSWIVAVKLSPALCYISDLRESCVMMQCNSVFIWCVKCDGVYVFVCTQYVKWQCLHIIWLKWTIFFLWNHNKFSVDFGGLDYW